jgi:hypothetical protein
VVGSVLLGLVLLVLVLLGLVLLGLVLLGLVLLGLVLLGLVLLLELVLLLLELGSAVVLPYVRPFRLDFGWWRRGTELRDRLGPWAYLGLRLLSSE